MITFSLKDHRIAVTFGFFFVLAITTLRNNRVGSLSLCFCIAHELGHLAMMQLFKVTASEIRLYGAGISISSAGISALSKNRRALVYFAGPLTNLFLAAFFHGDMRAVNLCLAMFNLLPVSYFDGGRLLCLILFENGKAAKIISVLSYTFLAILLIGAMLLRRESVGPSSLLTLCFIALSLILDK